MIYRGTQAPDTWISRATNPKSDTTRRRCVGPKRISELDSSVRTMKPKAFRQREKNDVTRLSHTFMAASE